MSKILENIMKNASALQKNVVLPEGEDASFFLCKELKKGFLSGVSGEYSTPQGYFVSEEECEEFDKQFPEKQKLRLPGQLW